MSRLVATFFFVGLLRPAPGTWGSAAALGLGMLTLRFIGFEGLLIGLIAVTLVGFWACKALLGDSGADPGEVVIDEVAGQWIALLFPAAGFFLTPQGQSFLEGSGGWLPWPAWVAPFALFRLFDIWKPWLVGRADRRGDAAGVMLDDLWAGLFAGVGAVILAVLYHIPLVLLK